MTATMNEPSTARPDRDGIAARLLVPAFWGAVSIVAMWLAVRIAETITQADAAAS